MASGSGFLHELRRRHVFRVAVAYAVVGWLVIQIATQVFPVFNLPNWATQLVVLLILLGFPIALVLTWAFEMTPEGVRRTEPAHSPEAASRPAAGRSQARLRDHRRIGAWRWALSCGASSDSARRRRRTATAAVAAKSVAVLPFENLSAEKENEYFASGMRDEILTRLAGIHELKVISRTSTERYRVGRKISKWWPPNLAWRPCSKARNAPAMPCTSICS